MCRYLFSWAYPYHIGAHNAPTTIYPTFTYETCRSNHRKIRSSTYQFVTRTNFQNFNTQSNWVHINVIRPFEPINYENLKYENTWHYICKNRPSNQKQIKPTNGPKYSDIWATCSFYGSARRRRKQQRNIHERKFY